ncbi:cell division protein DivIVA [soil metagenome]
MELGADDIQEQRFHDAWRGYNQEEVDDFLDRVAEVLEHSQRENVALNKRVGELEQAVATSRETEEMLKTTLVSAQQAAEEAKAKARAQAEMMVKEAEAHARRTTEESRERKASSEADIRRRIQDTEREHQARRRELDASIDRLREFETELKQRLKTFLTQQAKALDTLTEKEPPTIRASADPHRGTTPREVRVSERADTPTKTIQASAEEPPPRVENGGEQPAAVVLERQEEPSFGQRLRRSFSLKDEG